MKEMGEGLGREGEGAEEDCVSRGNALDGFFVRSQSSIITSTKVWIVSGDLD